MKAAAWTAFAGLLVGQFMAVLDVQIVASSFGPIKAGIGATSDEIGWIQTSYLVSETLGILLTGHWTAVFGLRRTFCTACFAFVATSVIAGLCQTLESLVALRVMQGFVGGVMLPSAFSFGFANLPDDDRPKVSLILAMTSTLAPTIGPTLGGWVSDIIGWRWLFFINVIPGLTAASIVWLNLDNHAGRLAERKPMDLRGFMYLSVALLSAQFVLEEGPKLDWSDSDVITALSALSAYAMVLFIARRGRSSTPVVDISLFKIGNFRSGSVMIAVAGISLFGGSYLMPLFLGTVRGYTPLQIGEALLVSGVVMFVTGLTLTRHLGRFDPRISMLAGFLAAAYGFWLGGEITSQWDYAEFAVLQAWRGAGVMIAVTATQTMTMAAVPSRQVPAATSLFFLSRNLGGAVGIAILSTQLAHQELRAYAELAASAYRGSPFEAIASNNDPLVGLARRQAQVLAFGDCFALVSMACLCAALLSLTMRRSKIERH